MTLFYKEPCKEHPVSKFVPITIDYNSLLFNKTTENKRNFKEPPGASKYPNVLLTRFARLFMMFGHQNSILCDKTAIKKNACMNH